MRYGLLTCLLLFWGALATATTIQEKSFAQLVHEAEGIVVGTVATSEARYGPDGDIYTFITLAELELLKGSYAGNAITLRQQGGEVAGDVLELVGAPFFQNGSRVVVFLRGNGRYIVPFVGWTQGVFRIQADETGTEAVFDHDGNRVHGMRNGALVKESRHHAAAEIVPGPRQARRSVLVTADSAATSATTGEAMSLAAFRKVIAGLRGSSSADTGAGLRSVTDFAGATSSVSLAPTGGAGSTNQTGPAAGGPSQLRLPAPYRPSIGR